VAQTLLLGTRYSLQPNSAAKSMNTGQDEAPIFSTFLSFNEAIESFDLLKIK